MGLVLAGEEYAALELARHPEPSKCFIKVNTVGKCCDAGE